MTEQKDIATVGVQVNQSAAIVSLIQRAATDESFDLEKLDRLLDVKERWEHEEARKAYVSALAAFKRNPPTLVKNQQVDFSARGGTHQVQLRELGRRGFSGRGRPCRTWPISRMGCQAGR